MSGRSAHYASGLGDPPAGFVQGDAEPGEIDAVPSDIDALTAAREIQR